MSTLKRFKMRTLMIFMRDITVSVVLVICFGCSIINTISKDSAGVEQRVHSFYLMMESERYSKAVSYYLNSEGVTGSQLVQQFEKLNMKILDHSIDKIELAGDMAEVSMSVNIEEKGIKVHAAKHIDVWVYMNGNWYIQNFATSGGSGSSEDYHEITKRIRERFLSD